MYLAQAAPLAQHRSYGVVFYEIMTAGAIPYVQWKNKMVRSGTRDGFRGAKSRVLYALLTRHCVLFLGQQVKEQLLKGYRLPCPAKCPPAFHAIMASTWDETPSSRPSSTQVIHELVKIKTSLATESAKVRRRASSESMSSVQASMADTTPSPTLPNPLDASTQSGGAPTSPRKVGQGGYPAAGRPSVGQQCTQQ